MGRADEGADTALRQPFSLSILEFADGGDAVDVVGVLAAERSAEVGQRIAEQRAQGAEIAFGDADLIAEATPTAGEKQS